MEDIKNLIFKFYDQPTLSYSFEQYMYVNNGKNLMLFHNDYVSYVEKGNLYELFDITLESKIKNAARYTVVNNKSYYGANISSPTTNYFINYFFSEKHPIAKIDSGIVFNQTNALKTLLNKNKYTITSRSLDSLYLLEVQNSDREESNLPGIFRKNLIIKLFISKKDGSIKQLTWQSSMEVNGRIDRTDSCIYTYSYYKLPKKEIVKKINAFVPFPEKDITQERNKMLDSLKYTFEQIKTFPGFNLPDTSETICKSSAITSKYVMVDFWYKNCGPCLMNMKYVEEIRQKFRKSDLEVIAINMADSLDADTKKVVRDFNTTYIWLFNGQVLNKSLNVYSYPTTLIYDNETREIIYRHVGASEAYAKTIISFLNSRLNEE